MADGGRITKNVQGPVRAGGGGMRPRRQRELGAEDAAAGLEVRRRGHPGVRDHRVVAKHLSGSGQEPGGGAARLRLQIH